MNCGVVLLVVVFVRVFLRFCVFVVCLPCLCVCECVGCAANMFVRVVRGVLYVSVRCIVFLVCGLCVRLSVCLC